MTDAAVAMLAPTGAPPLRQASTDQQLVDLWLHGRPSHTQRAYRADSNRFLVFVARRCPRSPWAMSRLSPTR
jgi:hypothetical protein